ncbi:glycoside hydrolase family 16 protein [Mariniflexile sp.]|uniref:glycoside hydrolase family 16 protein n=2 Tax=Mariniflexile sp. TaxID=1979402 RepID=UPI0040488064
MRLFLRKLTVIIVLLTLDVMSLSCSKSDSNTPDDPIDAPKAIIPENLTLNVTVLNSDTTNPNGNGLGKVTCVATADNSVKFGFIFGGTEETQNTSGNIEHTFTQSGTNNYTISVIAYSSTGHKISRFTTVTVYVKPPELQLIWSDEFDVDGSFSSNKWVAETIPGDNATLSWFNSEKQHYTNRDDNVYVSNGTLKIVAKKENYTYTDPGSNRSSTKQYTSARLITKGKFDFTYGRIDVRAKLPQGSGTWPAIWMLGSNIDTVGWPACGEIDIMEHWGHLSSIVSSATHTTACSGGCADVRVGETTITDYASEFHVYSLVWTQGELKFLIDDNFKYSYKPTPKNNDNWPYTANQFIILNVAMGGDWFQIDPDFKESTMEVDYVRVYQ